MAWQHCLVLLDEIKTLQTISDSFSVQVSLDSYEVLGSYVKFILLSLIKKVAHASYVWIALCFIININNYNLPGDIYIAVQHVSWR